MKFLLTGVETNNKGAELMLYAILQEIERKFPNSEVYIPEDRLYHDVSYIKTNLTLYIIHPSWLYRIIKLTKINGILRRLHIDFAIQYIPSVKGVDYYIDASGFRFTDQAHISKKNVAYWNSLLQKQKKKGSRIIFLPQAWGPIEKKNTKLEIKAISEYADLIFARENVSYEYLKTCNEVDLLKVKVCTDFTSLVEGAVSDKYKHLDGGICIIPNKQMVNKGVLSMDAYISFLIRIITLSQECGRNVYLLNHEGKTDEQLIIECKKQLGQEIEIVTDLNALETKGLISSAYLVVSSRYHGVASALNSCVPCLATSWSHKYACLFSDYDLSDCVLPLSDSEKCDNIIRCFLQSSYNEEIRNHLKMQMPRIKKMANDMWNAIWSV